MFSRGHIEYKKVQYTLKTQLNNSSPPVLKVNFDVHHSVKPACLAGGTRILDVTSGVYIYLSKINLILFGFDLARLNFSGRR